MIAHDHYIFFIDLDDTIYDRTPHRFGEALERVSSNPILRHFPPGALAQLVEAVRTLSPMFEELGYPCTQHRTDRPLFLAGMMLVFGPISYISSRCHMATSSVLRARRFVERFQRIVEAGPPGTWSEFLVQQLTVRQVMIGGGHEEAKQIVNRFLIDEGVAALAEQTVDNAVWESRHGFEQLWSDLERRGVNCYIASEGEEDLQKEKLVSLGLGPAFQHALLTSERASCPLDALALRDYSDKVFAETATALRDRGCVIDELGQLDRTRVQRLASEVDASVNWLAASRWVLSTFVRKTPGYYARLLHATVGSPSDPRRALDTFERVQPSRWTTKRVRVAMFGNYHAKDVVPIQQLLGRNRVWTGLLDEGLHRGMRKSDVTYLPTRVYPSWNHAVEELRLGLPWSHIEPLAEVRLRMDPEVVELLNRGRLDSRFQVVVKLAEFLN